MAATKAMAVKKALSDDSLTTKKVMTKIKKTMKINKATKTKKVVQPPEAMKTKKTGVVVVMGLMDQLCLRETGWIRGMFLVLRARKSKRGIQAVVGTEINNC